MIGTCEVHAPVYAKVDAEKEEEEEEEDIFIAQKNIRGGGKRGGRERESQRENETAIAGGPGLRWRRRQFHQKRVRVRR